MLPPRNLLIVILLATAVSTAPVEEKEREEVELEATEEVEGELSEEEEAGHLGTQQTITSVAAAGGSVSGGPSAGMGPNGGAAGSSAGLHGSVFSVDSAGSASSAGSAGPVGSAGYPGAVESSGSAGYPGSAGSSGSADSAGSADYLGSAGSVDSAGSAGSGGYPGSAGSGGYPGSAGSGGYPGSAGSASSVDPAGSAVHPGSVGHPGSVDSAGSAGSAGSVDAAGSAVHPGSVEHPGSADLAGSAGSVDSAASGSHFSAGQTHLGSERVDSMFNGGGNGQKFLNGGGVEGIEAHSQTGVLGTFGGGVSHLSHTGGSPTADMNAGIIDPSSHDYLLGLMGGGLINHFNSGSHVSIAGHKTPPTHLHSTVMSSGVTGTPSADKSFLDSPADGAHHSAISADPSGPDSLGSGPGLSADRPGPDSSSPGSGPDQTLSNERSGPDGFSVVSGLDHSLLRPASGSSLSAAGSSSSLDNGAVREQTEGAESADNNGNGRQTLLTDTNGAVTDRTASSSDFGSLQTDLTGGAAESVSRLHPSGPASTMEPARDVTESSLSGLHTASGVGVTHTLSGVSGIYSHTDFITVTADFIGRSTADPTGTPFDSSHPAATDPAQMAGSVTEQYNPSGQGPEGAENVELEDTC